MNVLKSTSSSYAVCGKPWEKVSPILVTLMSHSNSDFERSNVSLKENKPDGVNPNSNDIDCYVRKNEGKILWFSADCMFSSKRDRKHDFDVILG